jgi:hypothetical protein
MNLLRKIFGRKDQKPSGPIVTPKNNTEIKSKYVGFDIEYLPHAKRYFPRHKGMYLFWWNTKQNYSLESSISGCLYSDTQDGAEKIIDEYLELRGIGSEIIRIDEF